MRNSIRREFLIIIFFSTLVPVCISSVFLYMWAQIFQANQTMLMDAYHQQTRFAVQNYLLRLTAVADYVTESRELADFMASPGKTRDFAENLVFGRLKTAQDKFAMRIRWAIFDREGTRILGDQKIPDMDSPQIHSSQSGLYLSKDAGDVISVNPIRYDTQNLAGPTATLQGVLVLAMDQARITEVIPNLVKITALNGNLRENGWSLQTREPTLQEGTDLRPALLVLLFALILSVGWSFWMVRKRVMTPLHDLARQVSEKAGKAFAIHEHHEIVLLQKTFDAYAAHDREVREKLIQESKMAAIGRTTQMIAHDVRKPFSMIKMILGILKDTNDFAEMRDVVERLLPEVERTMAVVNGMLKDIMEVGNTAGLDIELVAPQFLIENSLKEVFGVFPQANVSLIYDFGSTAPVAVDVSRTIRVISNIVMNAVQAMQSKGEIRFVTRDRHVDGQAFVEFIIGNNGDSIPADSIKHIFEPFYTNRKRSGTGLGLAISRQIIQAHGGQIDCQSHESIGVEFAFTLPRGKDSDLGVMKPLPQHSRAFIPALFEMAVGGDITSALATQEQEERDIRNWSRKLGRRIAVRILDDEDFYRQALSRLITSSNLGNEIAVSTWQNAKDMRASLAKQSLMDVFICDIDLGDPDNDGYSIVADLRQRDFNGIICLHSNHHSPDDFRRAFSCGADLFLPKPLTTSHLLKLLKAAIRT